MKNVGHSIITLLTIISFTACAPEIVTPIQQEVASVEIDTIITFDAETFEETIEIVKIRAISTIEKEEVTNLAEDESYQIDTIISVCPNRCKGLIIKKKASIITIKNC